MAKKKWIILSVLILIILCAIYYCFKPANVADFDDILLHVEIQKPNSLVVSVENNTDTIITYSESFHIEKKSVLGWHQITIAPETIPCVERFLEPGKRSATQIINYEPTYGILSKGHYRIIREFDMAGNALAVAGYFDIP